MAEKKEDWFETTTVALAFAVVVALVLWRAAMLSSAAHDADRAAIINTVRIRSSDLEGLTMLYEEARSSLAWLWSQRATCACFSWLWAC